MIHLRKILGLVGVLSGVVFVLSLQKIERLNLSDYYTQLSVGVTLMTIGMAYWTFKPQIDALTSKISREEKPEKFEKHKQDILAVLEFQLYAYFPEFGDSGNGELSWESKDLYEYCIDHLKSYPDLWKSFEMAKNNSENVLNQIRIKFQECNNLVENVLGTFNELPESDRYLGYNEWHFMKNRFRTTLFRNISDAILNKTEVRPFNIINPSNTQVFILTDNSGECAIGDEPTIRKLRDLIKPLESDSKLRSLISEIEELKKQLRDPNMWSEFNKKREVLVRDLTKGQRNLKGHCNYCP